MALLFQQPVTIFIVTIDEPGIYECIATTTKDSCNHGNSQEIKLGFTINEMNEIYENCFSNDIEISTVIVKIVFMNLFLDVFFSFPS